MSKGRAIAAAMAGAMDGESTKLTDDAVVLLEQQYGPLDRNLPTGGSFGELSLADAKLARRNATIIAAEPASLIRIDKQLYRKTLYEMQVNTVLKKLTSLACLKSFFMQIFAEFAASLGPRVAFLGCVALGQVCPIQCGDAPGCIATECNMPTMLLPRTTLPVTDIKRQAALSLGMTQMYCHTCNCLTVTFDCL